jgi:hypothetical protein
VESVTVDPPAPSAPTLHAIDNADGDGDYGVDWSDVSGATGYTVQEDDNGSFSSPTTAYSGPNSQHTVSGQAAGTWYYRVRAYNAGGGYSPWSSARSVVVDPWVVCLPLLMRDYVTYFEGPWEREDNDNYLEANGPLRSGRDYYGYPDDARDYFSIYLRTGGEIAVDLTNHEGGGVQLLLYYRSPADRVGWVWKDPYHITYTGPEGWYYIFIYTASGYPNSTPYTLRVTYP